MSEKKENTKAAQADLYVVGIGASAGGLEALQELISHLPKDLENIAIVIAQHLSPTYKSMLVQLLSRQTKLEVVEIRNGMMIRANKIYITPPDSEITLSGGYFNLTKPASSAGPKPSIDTFFHSLSQEKKDKSIGIILSGTGSDGSYGIRAIKMAGGLTIAQEPQTAKYNGMPIASIETGQVDLVLAPDKIGEELKEILMHPQIHISDEGETEKSSSLDVILGLLSRRTGTDFSNYKPSTIFRRLDKRISELKLNSIDQYLKYIEENTGELDSLFKTILIGVTTFFRDEEAFEALETHLSKILSKKNKGDQVRIWVPGCASGEEPYSIAFLIAKLLNSRLQEYNIQIFATDIDENAINVARKGVYLEDALRNVPTEILEKYTIKKGKNEREIVKPIRQLILFSKHDVTTNPPFLKLDLISCRNLLIYFSQSLQQHVIPIFHYGLNPDGYLFLGKSETVGQFSDLFSTIEGKAKIFQRKRGNKISAIRFSSFVPKKQNQSTTAKTPKVPSKLTIPEMVKETLYNTFENSYVVVDNNMDVVQISGDVRMYLGINPGVMNTSILKLAHKDLQIDLRSLITNTIKNNSVSKGDIRRLVFFDNEYFVKIIVKPLLYSEPENGLYIVVFENFDNTSKLFVQTNEEDFEDNPRVVELEHELEGVKEHLQTFIEELETANEELQSLNEELQSSNEELQSSNEELETSNEELQSTNEELQIAYTELKSASEELEEQSKKLKISEANAKALLNNTLQSFILINKDYKIVAFNSTANQRAILLYNKVMKAGDSIIDFQPSGGLERFHKDFSKALKGQLVVGEQMVKVSGDQSRWFKYHFTPVEDEANEITVVSYSSLDITDQKRLEQELMDSEKLVNSIFNSADLGICVTGEDGNFVKVNKSYCEIYGYEMEELIGNHFTLVLPEEAREEAAETHTKYLQGAPESSGEWEVMHKSGKKFKVRVTTARVISEEGHKFKVTTVWPLNKL